MMKTRGIFVGGIVALALMAVAAPAAAKCGHGGIPCPDPARLRVTVDGPGLVEPIVIRGEDAWTMVNVTGVNYRPYAIHDGAPANAGPRYQAVYEFSSEDRILFLLQEIYPYANGSTYAFTPDGQWFVSHFADMSPSGELYIPRQEAGHGWRRSRTLQSILQEHGLPASPPAKTKGSVTAAGVASQGDGGSSPTGGLLAGALALLGAAGLTARWGFRRRSSARGGLI